MITNFVDLIVEYPNALSDDLCTQIIEKFEADPRKQEGQTGPNKISDLKKSTDLWISDFPDWRMSLQMLLNLPSVRQCCKDGEAWL